MEELAKNPADYQPRLMSFLQSGISRSSILQLKDAGVDVTQFTYLNAALDHFDALVDELETLQIDQDEMQMAKER